MNTKNALLANSKFIGLVLEGRNGTHKSYTNSVQITEIAIDEYQSYNGRSLYVRKGRSKNKRRAQNILDFMVKIDPVIVQRLGIRDGDAIAHMLEDGAYIIKLIFKDITKNGGQQEISQNPIDQDYRYVSYRKSKL